MGADQEYSIVAILLAGITGLLAVIRLLWKQISDHWARIAAEKEKADQEKAETQQRLQECEEDRIDLWHALADQRGSTVSEAQQHARNVREKRIDSRQADQPGGGPGD